MRHVATIVCLALLAACGKSAGGNEAAGNSVSSSFENGFRTSYRTKFVESCTTGAKSAAQRAGNVAAAGLNYEPLCGCAADRLLATKTMAELMRGPSQQEQAQVTEACLKEHPLT